jgi:hypothetical protein
MELEIQRATPAHARLGTPGAVLIFYKTISS